jgi:hypothetical protein
MTVSTILRKASSRQCFDPSVPRCRDAQPAAQNAAVIVVNRVAVAVVGTTLSVLALTCGVRKLDPCDVQDARVAQFAGETELTHPTRIRERLELSQAIGVLDAIPHVLHCER